MDPVRTKSAADTENFGYDKCLENIPNTDTVLENIIVCHQSITAGT